MTEEFSKPAVETTEYAKAPESEKLQNWLREMTTPGGDNFL